MCNALGVPVEQHDDEAANGDHRCMGGQQLLDDRWRLSLVSEQRLAQDQDDR